VSKEAIIGATRIIGAAVMSVALGFQAWADLTYGTFTWAQLPGYFTPLATLAGITALIAAAATGASEPPWVASLRVNAATYLVIVAVVYWAMLARYTTPMFPWANAVLHGGAGAMLVADWVLVGERRRLPLRGLWSVLSLPALWLGYTLARAVLDDWVPYPFLDPARGPLAIATTLGVLAAAGLLAAVAMRSLAVWRPLGLRNHTRPARPSRLISG
jgi:hypothetical protein